MSQEIHDQSGGKDGAQTEGLTKGGEGVDFEALFGKTNQELSETKAKADKISSDFESFKSEAKKTAETLERMRSVLVGKEEGADADPSSKEITKLEAEIDDWVQKAFEAERAGKPMPLTAKIGIENARRHIEFLKKEQEFTKKTKEMEEQLKKVSDPEFASNNALYDATDNLIQQSLNTIYGEAPELATIKESQFAAVANQVGLEFQDLQKNLPDEWKRIKRDRTALSKLVQHVVKQNIPPVARKLMEQDEIRRNPMDLKELMAAVREQQKVVKSKPNDPDAKKLLRQLREEAIQTYWDGQFKGSSKLRLQGG